MPRPSFDLNHPPVVIYQGQLHGLLRFAILFTISAVIGLVGVISSLGSPERMGRSVEGSIGILAILLLCARPPRPDELHLSPDRLIRLVNGKRRIWKWEAVEDFRVELDEGHKVIAFDNVKRDCDEQFDSNWEIEPEELAALLSEARARWGPPVKSAKGALAAEV